MTDTNPTDSDRERPRTVGDVMAFAMYDAVGESCSTCIARICAALCLDPDTVLDGPVVVLHPGDRVVRTVSEFDGQWYRSVDRTIARGG